MTGIEVTKLSDQVEKFTTALSTAKRVLITAPAEADGDSVGTQLALRRMILHRFPGVTVEIINDMPLPPRYLFLPDVASVKTPDTSSNGPSNGFDVAVIVDGGIDRAGRVRELFNKARTRVFLDHHVVSADYLYDIRIVEPSASSTTELVYYLSQFPGFQTPLTKEFAEQIYLGLVFDTGFFRHSNTTPEAMELGARMIRTGFDFTRVGERGMLVRSFVGLRMMSETLQKAQLLANGKIIWSDLSQATVRSYGAIPDDREGIIDQLFLTEGVEVAVLFFELNPFETKVSFRSQGVFDVARFARSLTERGGGHRNAAGANFQKPMKEAQIFVLSRLEKQLEDVISSSCC